MKAVVVKIVLPLLVIALVTSNVVAQSRLHREYKNGEDHHERSSSSNTYTFVNEDGMEPRAVVPQMVFYNHNLQYYTQFFAGGRPPIGLRTGQNNLQDIRYICQMVNQQTYYGTMFDENRGIAVYSAYTLTQANANFPNRQRPGKWAETPGIRKQGSDAIYLRQPFDKGHLVPGATYSNTADSLLSTFFHTNAVPQRRTFNRGQWCQFEKRIRVYARQCTQRPQPGTLFLITGTAFGHIRNNPQGMNQVQVTYLGPAGNCPAIAVPNSMWTAGCCVRPNGIKSFAVIGNNLEQGNQILTQQITVAQLQGILKDDVDNSKVVLFPGNGDCSNENNNLANLPRAPDRRRC